MERTIVVPYDGSPTARAVLRRAAAAAAAAQLYCCLVIATVGLEPADVDDTVVEATRVAGPGLPVQISWLRPADPLGSLRRLLADASDASLAVPLSGRERSPWYGEACRASDVAARTMIFFVGPRDLEAAGVRAAGIKGLLGALRWAMVRLLPRRSPAAAGAPSSNGRVCSRPATGHDRLTPDVQRREPVVKGRR